MMFVWGMIVGVVIFLVGMAVGDTISTEIHEKEFD